MQFADQVQTRIFEGKQGRASDSHIGNQQDKYNSFLHLYEESFQALLDQSSGSWHAVLSRARFVQQSVEAPVFAGLADNFDVQQLADKGANVHATCNTEIPASDAQLKKDAKKMCAFVEMLREDMPYECALVTHFDWVTKDLFNL